MRSASDRSVESGVECRRWGRILAGPVCMTRAGKCHNLNQEVGLDGQTGTTANDPRWRASGVGSQPGDAGGSPPRPACTGIEELNEEQPHGTAQDGPNGHDERASGGREPKVRGSRPNDMTSPMSAQVDVTANCVAS